jgi:hypothetical protein
MLKHLLILTILITPALVGAQSEYIPLVGVPGVEASDTSFSSFINALYVLSIVIAGLLAVIKIVIGGVKWMLTDIVTSKADAKKDIRAALIGLMVVLGAVLILTVINPQLTQSTLNLKPAVVETPADPIARTASEKAVIEAGIQSVSDGGKEICDRTKTKCTKSLPPGAVDPDGYDKTAEVVPLPTAKEFQDEANGLAAKAGYSNTALSKETAEAQAEKKIEEKREENEEEMAEIKAEADAEAAEAEARFRIILDTMIRNAVAEGESGDEEEPTNLCPEGMMLDPELGGLTLGGTSCIPIP